MMHDWNGYYWGMPMMWFVWPLVILIIWFLIRRVRKDMPSEKLKESPIDVLKRRYANGEITTEEYEQRKKVLEKE